MKGESSKFEVWSLEGKFEVGRPLGGVLKERVTACHGVSGDGQLPAHAAHVR